MRVEDGDWFVIIFLIFVEIKYVIYVFLVECGEFCDLYVEMYLLIDYIILCDEGINFLLSRDNLVIDFVG